MNLKRLLIKGLAKAGFDAAKKALAEKRQREEDEKDAAEAAAILKESREQDNVLWEELSAEDDTLLDSPECNLPKKEE